MVVALADRAQAPEGTSAVDLREEHGAFGRGGVQGRPGDGRSAVAGGRTDLDRADRPEGGDTVDGRGDDDLAGRGRQGCQVDGDGLFGRTSGEEPYGAAGLSGAP